MGNSESNRSITISDDDKADILVLTEDVVKRLHGQERKNRGESQVIERPDHRSADHSHKSEPVEPNELYNQRVDAILKQTEQVYSDVLEHMKEEVERVEEKFVKQTQPLPCSDVMMKLGKCYRENSKQTLECSALAKEFRSCAAAAKKEKMTPSPVVET